MRLYRAAELRAIDQGAADAGVATRGLMANAGAAVARAARRHWPAARSVLLLCGPGNNGGDGFVAAEALARGGLRVRVAELRPGEARGDAAWALESLRASGAAVDWLEPGAPLPLDEVDLVVDALVGTGLRRPLGGPAAAWAEALARRPVPVLAVDVPSGVDADRARPPGAHVRATRTVQLAGAVPASLLAPAREAFGAAEVADIGVPAAILERHARGRRVDRAWLRGAAPRRAATDHKYRAGSVLVVGGATRYAGAAELAARGAYRAGAGLVTLVADGPCAGGWPEVVRVAPSAGTAVLDAARTLLAERTRPFGAVVVGPGLVSAPGPLVDLLTAGDAPTVLDAGALVPELRATAASRGACVLTPHAGEAARLLAALDGDDAGLDPVDDPVAASLALAAAWGATCVLKGPVTVVAAPDGRWALSDAGTPDLATGGSGDVLAGVIAAFLAARPGAGAFDLAAAAVHLHGLAGARAGRDGPGAVASDVIEALRGAAREALA